jgi:glutamine amidotransferase
MISIIDIGTGNLHSVLEALRRVGTPGILTRSASEVEGAKGIILPGVGAFGEGMQRLNAQCLAEPIRTAARSGVPVLGVCLGMQLLAEVGYEHGRCEGLGLLAGEVVPLVAGVHCERVPNMGWRGVRVMRDGSLIDRSCDGAHYFFAHSFHFVPNEQRDVVATVHGGVMASVERGNVFGAQFHPEKSQDAGLDVLARFASIVRSGTRRSLRRADAA